MAEVGLLSLPFDKTISVWLICTSVCRAGLIYFKSCIFVCSKACEVLSGSSLSSFHMEHFLNEELKDLRDRMQLADGSSCTTARLINAF